MARRREALADLLREHGADQALVYGFAGPGRPSSGSPAGRSRNRAAAAPGQRDLLFVCFNNRAQRPEARPDADVRPTVSPRRRPLPAQPGGPGAQRPRRPGPEDTRDGRDGIRPGD
jgi:hypothetical protein